mmetsp:Transcript_16293/g.32603  ORF Transcript_16293/g.32603 Transcript_16293/m.32603 type:complete len:571 (+) Transcript_16293:46-1758(+)|eukprot:CAMPEP_0181308976 /NCGR_PEP_ID=MMETSP1101-20121128/11767_1 /TAXON_ID=46948 /ORGANISM="Rhodomonas abbreviata, Strain Caron Lab Isolate" /LENGTH=570 /DNA_ID=CAMNT_0023415429 /DNA_START=45 /DNA_END=1757 /DNA_ORIENTATION=+
MDRHALYPHTPVSPKIPRRADDVVANEFDRKLVTVLDVFAKIDLLRWIWPANYVVLGCRVCKTLKKELAQFESIVMKASKGCQGIISPFDFADGVNQFEKTGVEIHAEGCRGLLYAICGQRANFEPSWCKKIGYLDLSYNEMDEHLSEHLSVVLKYCENLSSLVLKHNKIEDHGVQQICNALERTKVLKQIDLCGNNLGTRGAKSLGGLLCRAEFKHLNIGQSIGGNNANVLMELATGLKRCSSCIETLILQKNLLRKRGAHKLAFLLPSLLKLQHLDIGGNDFTNEDADVLCTGLLKLDRARRKAHATVCSGLRLLDLSDNKLSGGMVESLKRVVETGKHLEDGGCGGGILEDLETLNLHANELLAEGAHSLAGLLPSFPKLQHIDVGGNRITDSGCKAVCNGLQVCRGLRVLDLSYNSLSGAAAESLKLLFENGMEHHTHGGCVGGLEVLRLGGNTLEEDGSAARASDLVSSLGRSLVELDLGRTNLRARGATHLAHALPRCSRLTRLVLSSNPFGSEGGVALSIALPHCTALRSLAFGAAGLGPQAASHLCAHIALACPRLDLVGAN